jgi:hypothetical protein
MIQKITLATLAFLCCSFFVNAQIKEGSILVGGQVYYANTTAKTSNSNASQKQNYGAIDLSLGKAIKENTVLGINLEFAPGTSNQVNNGSVIYKTKAIGYGAGVFYRRYKTLAKDFYFFIEGGVNFFYNQQTTRDSAENKIQKITNSTAQIYLAPGISYKVLKNLHLEVSIPQLTSLAYTNSKTSYLASRSSQNNISFQSNLNASTLNNLSVGFRLIF